MVHISQIPVELYRQMVRDQKIDTGGPIKPLLNIAAFLSGDTSSIIPSVDFKDASTSELGLALIYFASMFCYGSVTDIAVRQSRPMVGERS